MPAKSAKKFLVENQQLTIATGFVADDRTAVINDASQGRFCA
jgi:hypothetical protein